MTAVATEVAPVPKEEREEGAVARQSALVSAIAALRPARRGGFPLATVLLVLGGLCLPLGFAAILLGWYGTSHTLNTYEQNSYLISGGVLGLGLVIVGGFFYFGYWMTKQLEVTRSALQQAMGAFSRVERRLDDVATNAAASNGYAAPAPTKTIRLVATERGSLVHRPDCQVVSNKGNLRSVEADPSRQKPCQICRPFEA